MAFDPTTATTQPTDQEMEFDPSTAVKIKEPQIQGVEKPTDITEFDQSTAVKVEEPKEQNTTWNDLYAGRYTPQQKAILSRIQDPEEKNRILNQSFAQYLMPELSSDIVKQNWPSIRSAIGKSKLRLPDEELKNLNDTKLFNEINNSLVVEQSGEIKPFSWPKALLSIPANVAYQTQHSMFWKGLNKPSIEIKKATAKDIKILPDQVPEDYSSDSAAWIATPAIAAGVYNTVSGIIEGSSSLKGILETFALAGLGKVKEGVQIAAETSKAASESLAIAQAERAAPEVIATAAANVANANEKYNITKKLLLGTNAYFVSTMGKTAYDADKDLFTKVKDPNVSTEDKISAVGAAVLSTVAATATILDGALNFISVGKANKFVNEAYGLKASELSIKATQESLLSATIDEQAAWQSVAEHYDELQHFENGPETWPSRGEFVNVDTNKESFDDTLPESQQKEVLPQRPLSALEKKYDGTSLKNAVGELERIDATGEAFTPAEERAMAPRWIQAGEVLAKDPNAGAVLTERLKQNPNIGLTDDQSALLLRHKVQLQNALETQVNDLNDLSRTPEERSFAANEAAKLSDQLVEFLDAVKRRGTEWGREGRWRQAIAKEDYTFSTQSTLLRAAKKGAQLTSGEIEVLAKQTSDLQKAQAEYESSARADLKQTPEDSVQKFVEENKATKKKNPKTSRTETLRKKLSDSADKSRAALEEIKKGGRLFDIQGVGPEAAFHVAVIGAEKIYSTGLDFVKWSNEMIKDFGENIKPYLTKFWEDSKSKYFIDHREAATELLSNAHEVGDLSAIGSIAKELALGFVAEGEADAKNLIKSVFKELKKGVPDITERQTAEAISGYGKYRKLSKNEIVAKLRDLQAQQRLQLSLEDIKTGKAPPRQGYERRVPSEEEKSLAQQVKIAREEAGMVVKKKTKAAVDKFKNLETSLSKRINELTKQFETGIKPEGKPVVEVPQKIQDLRDLRDRISSTIKDLEPSEPTEAKVVTPQEELQNKIKALDTSISKLESELQEGKIRPDVKEPSTVASPELEEKQKYYDSLKQFREELRNIEEPEISSEQRALESQKARLEAQIEKRKAVLESGAPRPERPVNRPAIEEIEKAKQELELINKKIAELRKPKPEPEIEKTSEERLNEKRQKYLKKQIDDLQRQIDSRQKDVNSKTSPSYNADTEALQAERDELKTKFDEIFKKPELTDLQRENRYNTFLDSKIKRLEEKINNNDFEPDPKKEPLKLSKETLKKKAKVGQLQSDILINREKARIDSQNKAVRVLKQTSDIVRASALSGIGIFGKLFSFSVGRLVEFGASELGGIILKQTPGLRDLMAAAKLETGGEVQALAAYYKKFATEGFSEAWQILKNKGIGRLDLELGKAVENAAPVKWYDYFGIAHKAAKAPEFVAQFEVNLQRGFADAISREMDLSDELVQGAIRKQAYEDAFSSVLKENNKFANWIKQIEFDALEKKPDLTPDELALYVAGTTVKVFLTKGIVRASANYVTQAIERSPYYLSTIGVTKTVAAYRAGLENIPPAAVNSIAKMWKVGLVGSGFFVGGFLDAMFNPPEKRIAGGYYQPGKRDPKDVPFGQLRINGFVIPHVAGHNLLAEEWQMGSTLYRVIFEKYRNVKFKDQDELTSVAAGIAASIAGLAIQGPLAGPGYRIAEDISRAQYNKLVQDEIASLVPTISAQLARNLDPKTGKFTLFGETNVRDPKGIPQAIEQEIPFARQLVPLKKKKTTGYEGYPSTQ